MRGRRWPHWSDKSLPECLSHVEAAALCARCGGALGGLVLRGDVFVHRNERTCESYQPSRR